MMQVEPIIQVAGVLSLEESKMLIHQGVTHIGMPLGPGVREQDLSLDEAAQVVKELQTKAQFILITYLTEPGEVAALCQQVGVCGVQLHADLPPENVAKLKEIMPRIIIFKSLVVGEGNDVLVMAREHAPQVDAFITDTFDPATGARGATGMVHDWSLSREIVRSVKRPVLLAGGLHEGNVAEAILATGAAGVDAHTGLEDAQGRKDEAKVRLFVERALEVLR